MRRITFAVVATIILGALILALPKLKSEVRANPVASPAAPQLGAKACTNVKFQFTNNRSDKAKIQIEKVQYTLSNGKKTDGKDGDTKTEDVHTKDDCPFGHTCTTTGDNLPDADRRTVTNIVFGFKFLSTAPGSKWSTLVYTATPQQPSDPICKDGRTYGPFSIPPK
jgi:hypothetical protein